MSVGGSLTPLLTQEMGGDRVPPLGSASDANESYTERASLPTGEAFKHQRTHRDCY